MKSFRFTPFPKILFSAGGIDDLPQLVKEFGQHIILVTGKSSFITSEKGASLLDKFGKERINYNNVIITGEPSPDDIDMNVSRLKESKFDCVVGIGGGSVLDAGKAISAMITQTGSVSDYLEGVGTSDHPGTKLPYIAVPTTSGTGSEATKNAVISRIGKNGFKRSLRHDNFVPDIALIDPELTINCPENITAASGMDCFTQLLEAFLSNKSNPFTDALAIQGLRGVKDSLIQCVNNGHDIEARSGMSFAALTSGICLANSGLGVVHGFASSIGGMYNIPHGIICGTLMASSNEVIVRKLKENNPDSAFIKKYALIGELFSGTKGKSEEEMIDGFIEYLHRITYQLHLPSLRQAGVKESDLKEIALITECKNNPVKLDNEELLEILIKRF